MCTQVVRSCLEGKIIFSFVTKKLKIYLEKKHACLLNNTTKIYSTILRSESFYRRRQLFFQIVVRCC